MLYKAYKLRNHGKLMQVFGKQNHCQQLILYCDSLIIIFKFSLFFIWLKMMNASYIFEMLKGSIRFVNQLFSFALTKYKEIEKQKNFIMCLVNY